MRAFQNKLLTVSHPSHITIIWAQNIIDQQKSNIKVEQVIIASIDVGTTTRISVTVDHNGPDSLPRQWFVKIPSLKWRVRAITALPRLLHTESRFYNEIALTTPTTIPTALFAKSNFGRGSTLVLGDIYENGARPGNPSEALSAHQALLVIEQLALLHAKFWNIAHTNPEYRWLSGPIRRLEDHLGTVLATPLMKRGLKKASSLVPSSLHAPVIHYAQHRRKAMNFLSRGVQTIIHHDCHPGNLFWSNEKPGLLDWQMVRMGEGISDIAYFLATSLTPETRRENEIEFIKHYIKTLADNGVQQLNFKQIQQRYKAHLVYPFEAMVITLAVGEMMDVDTNLKLIERTATAAKDNNAFAMIPI